MKTPKAFISYARNDRQAAVRLAEELKVAGADPWLDIQKLVPGENWKDAVQNAMQEADFFVALISKESVAKAGYVQKELKDALEILDRLPPSKIYMIPARLDDSRPAYKRLHDLHWVDLFPTWEMGFGQLARAMGLEPGKGWEPDELDLYIRNNIELTKFQRDERWGDGRALVYVEYAGYDGLFVFWNVRERLLEKWYRYGEIRWSGPERLTDQDRAKVWKSLNYILREGAKHASHITQHYGVKGTQSDIDNFARLLSDIGGVFEYTENHGDTFSLIFKYPNTLPESLIFHLLQESNLTRTGK